MTYTLEPAGEEIMDHGIAFMTKCLQCAVPTLKNTLLPGPKYSHLIEDTLQRKIMKPP